MRAGLRQGRYMEGYAMKNTWKCSKCGFTVETDAPPEKCPGCKEKCEFLNVTCYIPECGLTGSDPRLK
jgi:rubrerythrin